MSHNPVLQYCPEDLFEPINIQNSSMSYLMLHHRQNLQRSRGDRFIRCLDKARTKFGITRRLIMATKVQSKEISIEDAKIIKREYKYHCILKTKIEHMETFKRLSIAQKKEVLDMRRQQILAKQEEIRGGVEVEEAVGIMEANIHNLEQTLAAIEI